MNSSGPSDTLLGSFVFLRVPAVRALLIQIGTFALTLVLVHLLAQIGMQATVLAWAFAQGVIAAAFSRVFRLAPWWALIQAVLPVALISTLALRIPPFIFLIAFLALLSIYWSTFRTQVPFYPSGSKVWEAVAGLLPADRPVQMMDIGSGLGGLVMHLAKVRGDSTFTGIELAPLPWLFSSLRCKFVGSRASFIRGDYEKLDFAAYDVVFAYLSPAAMPALWRKARAEMRAGTLLLSYEFDIRGVAPHLMLVPVESGPSLYGWRM